MDEFWASASRVLLVLLGLTGLARPAAAVVQDRWFVTSDGVRLHWIDAGQGPTIVLVPGWTMPAWIFERQIAAFSRTYHVVALDPRGQGLSDVPHRGYDHLRRAEDIAELLDQLGPSPVLLGGWSLGVLDVLAYVHEHGDARIAGLVLIDNSVGEDPPPSSSGGSSGHRLVHPTRTAWMHNFVSGMFETVQPTAYIDRLTAACLRTPEPAADALLNYPVPRTYWKAGVYATAKPVLYVVRPRLAGQAANLELHHPAAETVVMQGVGHALFVDDAPRFDAILLGFIQRRIWPGRLSG